MRLSTIAAMAALLLCAGCAGVDLVTAGKPADLGDGVSVVSPVAWARIRNPAATSSLTIDGVGLGEIRYYTGIAPGKPIIDIGTLSNAEIGTYNAAMLPNEIMDLLASNMEKTGCQNVHASNLAPMKFGSVMGFHFDVSYVTKEGLEMRGAALSAQRGGKLDVLLFVAPNEDIMRCASPTPNNCSPPSRRRADREQGRHGNQGCARPGCGASRSRRAVM